MDYNKTINLPKTDFPMRAGLPNREPGMLQRWNDMDLYHELLKKNAEALKGATVDIARESERGIVDIETLTATNEALISTLDEVRQIQTDAKTRRREAQAELVRIEGELKKKLLEVSVASLEE